MDNRNEIFANEDIISHAIDQELTQSYIDYAMTVIVSRALPDVRDWLKPVQRRILFAMFKERLLPSSKYSKSMWVVWEVLKKYHPHWDSSVYEAMVKIAQPFSMRYPLVDGQWNFWSIDWDWAAAPRYTEARMSKLALEMMQDIDYDTVFWRDNYDNTTQEPVSLPTRFPNHLCNGTMWIAVWMATNMAPHNLKEVIDAIFLLIQNPEASIDQIMEIIKWPDFPTGWTIFDSENIKSVYSKWKWAIMMRANYHIEEEKWEKKIIIDQLPYQVNKANLVEKIATLVNEKKIEWISEITDESHKDIIRIVIEIRNWIDEIWILTKLFKYTELQSNFNVNNVTLVEWGLQPRLLNIKDLLQEFVDYRRIIVHNRSVYLLAKANDRLHILEWLKKAIDVIDEVIATIRGSETKADAKTNLMEKFEFSEPQSEYILMMRLQTLVWLEIKAVLDEINEKLETISYLNSLLSDPKKLDSVIIDELQYIKDEYGDDRRTQISNDNSIYNMDAYLRQLKKQEDFLKEDVILLISNDYETKVLYQSRINVIPEDVFDLKYTHNQDKLVIVTDKAELVVARLKDLGQHNVKNKWVDFKAQYWLKWEVVFVGATEEDFENIALLTNKNSIKKVTKELLLSFQKFPTFIMSLENWEKIIKAIPTKTWDNIWVISQNWNMVLFPEAWVRAMWKTSGWITAISLDEGESVASMIRHSGEPFIFLYSDKGWKMISLEDLKIQKRAQAGLQVAKLEKWEKLVWGIAIDDWGVKMLLANGHSVELHSNNMKLKTPSKPLDPVASETIKRVYRPWQERKK